MIEYIFPFLFLSSGLIANKFILREWSPGLLVGMRMILSGIILGSFALYQKWKKFLEPFQTTMALSRPSRLLSQHS